MASEREPGDKPNAWLPRTPLGQWNLRLVLLVVPISLAVVQKSGMGAGFITAGGVLIFTSTLALPSAWLRLVRLTAGGTAAASGASSHCSSVMSSRSQTARTRPD